MASSLVLLISFLQVGDVVVTQLSGEPVRGSLVELSPRQVTLGTADGDTTVPIEQVIELRPADPRHDKLPGSQVYLTDGSTLSFESLQTAGRELLIRSPVYGELKLPLGRVRAIRFGELRPAADAWNKLLARKRSKDVLVLPKKNQTGELDPTTGVVGQIGKNKLRFVLGGDEIPVDLPRVFGVVYANLPVQTQSPFVVSVGGVDRIAATQVLWRADSDVQIELAAGVRARVAAGYVHAVDCSGGKVRYLDEMQPVFHEFSSVIPDPLYEKVFRYRVNETMDGEPLRLGGKTYERGLWIHSKTRLRFATAGEYARFQAVVGIDDKIPRQNDTKARLTIRADDRVVFDEDVRLTDKPRDVSCNIAGAQTLEILVDYGEKRDDGTPPLHAALQDWVDLADARVLK